MQKSGGAETIEELLVRNLHIFEYALDTRTKGYWISFRHISCVCATFTQLTYSKNQRKEHNWKNVLYAPSR